MQTSNSGLETATFLEAHVTPYITTAKPRLILIRLANLIHEFFDMRSLACQRQRHNTANVHVRAVDAHV